MILLVHLILKAQAVQHRQLLLDHPSRPVDQGHQLVQASLAVLEILMLQNCLDHLLHPEGPQNPANQHLLMVLVILVVQVDLMHLADLMVLEIPDCQLVLDFQLVLHFH